MLRRVLPFHTRLPALLVMSASPALLPAQVERVAATETHGVSLKLARHRVEQVRNVRYDLSSDLSAFDSAPGRVRIRFDRTGSDDIIADFRGRRLTNAIINGTAGPVSFDGNHIRIPARLLRAGSNVAEFTFVSEIAPSGASIIRTHDATDGADYLYTLLVPADANQLFPCFDQPDLKARITLSLTSRANWVVVSNGSETVAVDSGGRRVTRFAETRPLSTYLLAFAAGPWVKHTATSGARTINLYVRRSRDREVDADTLLALSGRALSWMESYFARPYPFEKFDVLLSPAFPFGGMEHPGLVMYNEDRFIFRDRPTLARRIGRFSTILHETAHQWFGDLVTMRWFDDLWLKEGFATYMGAKALADLEPSSDAWKAFYQSNKPAAYGVDQTAGTTSLWQPLDNLDQAKSAYGAIVYNKAPSILKQLNYLVGEAAFRRGVQGFLASYGYGNATWQQLLDAIGTASGRSLTSFGDNFMRRPGMPIVETELVVKNGRIARLILHQRPARLDVSGGAAWPMRTRVLLARNDGTGERLDVELKGAATDVVAAKGRPAPAFVYPNADDYGYFLSLLDTASVHALSHGAIRAVADPMLRSMLWGSLWDQVRESRLAPDRFTSLVLEQLPFERDEQIVPVLTARLERALRAYVTGPTLARLRDSAESTLWRGATDAGASFGVRRANLTAFIAVAASPPAREHLIEITRRDTIGGDPIRDPLRWSVAERLLVLDDAQADTVLGRQALRDTTADGQRLRFTVAAGRRSADTKHAYFTRYFADRSLNEDWATGSLGPFNAVEHETLTLPYLKPALDSLRFVQANRRIFFLGSWLGAFLGGQTSDGAFRTVRDWLQANPSLATDLRQKVLQNADELERTVEIRRRWSDRR